MDSGTASGGFRPNKAQDSNLQDTDSENGRAPAGARNGGAWGPLAVLGVVMAMVVALTWMAEYLTVDQYLVRTGDAYVRVSDGSADKDVIATLAASEIAYVAVGQAVTIDVPGLAAPLYGHVVDAELIDAAPRSRPGDDRIALKIRLRKDSVPTDLREGTAVTATILTGLTGTETLVSTVLQERAAKLRNCNGDIRPASVRRNI